MTSDRDGMLLGEMKHGIWDRVVLFSLGLLSAVPLHLILEYRELEPRCEPVLIGCVGEDVIGHGTTQWEAQLFLLNSDVGIRYWLVLLVEYGDSDPCLPCLQNFGTFKVYCKFT